MKENKETGLISDQTQLIIEKIADGYSNQLIADELGIEVSDINTLVKQPKIQKAIADLSKEVMASFGSSKDQIKTMMRRVILADLTDFYDDKGNMKPFREIPLALRQCITELEFKHGVDAMGMPCTHTRIKTVSKDKAVEIMARLDNLFNEKPDTGGLKFEIGYGKE